MKGIRRAKPGLALVLVALWMPGTILYLGWTLILEQHFSQFGLKVFLGILGICLAAIPWYAAWPLVTKVKVAAGWFALLLLASMVFDTAGFIWSCATLVGCLFLATVRLLTGPIRSRQWMRTGVALAWLPLALFYAHMANSRYFLRYMDYARQDRQPPLMRATPIYDIVEDGFRATGSTTHPNASDATWNLYFAGDSIVWGFPYPATYAIPAVVARGLQGVTSATVWNAGQPSQSVAQVRARLSELVVRNVDTLVLITGYQWQHVAKHQKALQAGKLAVARPENFWNLLPPFAMDVAYFTRQHHPEPLTDPMKIDAARQLYRQTLADLLQRTHTLGIQIVMVENPAANLDPQIRKINKELGTQYAAVFVPTLDLFASPDDYAFRDWIHPKPAGLEAIGKRILAKLKELQTGRAVLHSPSDHGFMKP